MHRLSRAHVAVGKPLLWAVYDSANQMLLRKGYVIETETQLEGLLARGMYADAANLQPVRDPKPAEQRYDPFWLWDDIIIKLGLLLRSPEKDGSAPYQVEGIARLVQVLTTRSSDAALAAIMLMMDQRRYPIVHSLHSAVLCDLVAARLEWPEDRRRSVVCAALTMNIAMIELQQVLSNQRNPLTPEQRLAINGHPGAGEQLLRDMGVTDPVWLQAVRDHHETPLGTGYPRGISDVGEEATLLHTADVFTAKVSPRAYRKPMTGTQASRILFTEAGMTTNNRFISVLIKEIGIYLPGSFVKLANGEIAVVYKRSASAHTPLVLSLINSQGAALLDPVRRDTTHEEFKVLAAVTRENILVNFDPAKIWKEL
jgi:HD-GYP domain-containing protein (c-di-GMP phosphodiesterase class II)